MEKFKNWLNENAIDDICFRIFRYYFYNLERSENKENLIVNQIEFPIKNNELQKLNTILNILIENKKETDIIKNDILLSIINKYFNSKNNKEQMFTFLRDRNPRLNRNNLDDKEVMENLFVDFHKLFAKS